MINYSDVTVKFGDHKGEGFTQRLINLKEAVELLAVTQDDATLESYRFFLTSISWDIKRGVKPMAFRLDLAREKVVRYSPESAIEIFKHFWAEFLTSVAKGNGEREFYNDVRECVAIIENELFRRRHPQRGCRDHSDALDYRPKATTGFWTVQGQKKFELLEDGTLEEVENYDESAPN